MSITKLALPEYELTLPMSGETIKFRPFTVKEEKILLLAQEENNISAIILAVSQMIDACTFSVCSIDTLNKVDAEFLFINLRNKSLGEGVEVNGLCKECNGKNFLVMDLEDVNVRNKDFKKDVKLKDNVWVTMRIPTIKESLKIGKDDGYTAIALCLDTMVEGDSSITFTDYPLEDRIEWVESLSPIQLQSFGDFFNNVPTLEFKYYYTCSHCQAMNTIIIEGLEGFFV